MQPTQVVQDNMHLFCVRLLSVCLLCLCLPRDSYQASARPTIGRTLSQWQYFRRDTQRESVFLPVTPLSVGNCDLGRRCWLQDEAGRWNKYGGRLPWDTSAICCNNAVFGGTGNHKTGEDYVAAPNIDHTQDFVRKDIIKWLKLLRSIGFDGFRFDFVKGYSASRFMPFSMLPVHMLPPSFAVLGYLSSLLELLCLFTEEQCRVLTTRPGTMRCIGKAGLDVACEV